MVLPPMEEVPAPVETPVEALQGESVAPPSLDPIPPTSNISEPSDQTSQRAPSSEVGARRARSELVRRFREVPRSARLVPALAATSDVRQAE